MKTTVLLLCIASCLLGIASLLLPKAHTVDTPEPQTLNGLKLVLALTNQKQATGVEPQLTSTFENVGKTPVSLVLWWNSHLRIIDAKGKIVPPGPGQLRPVGLVSGSSAMLLQPGETLSREEGFSCIRPAGAKEDIGYSYQLKPGTYRISLIYQSPSGYRMYVLGEFPGNMPADWTGKLVSNEVTVKIGPGGVLMPNPAVKP